MEPIMFPWRRASGVVFVPAFGSLFLVNAVHVLRRSPEAYPNQHRILAMLTGACLMLALARLASPRSRGWLSTGGILLLLGTFVTLMASRGT
jgi:hypothetical protein